MREHDCHITKHITHSFNFFTGWYHPYIRYTW